LEPIGNIPPAEAEERYYAMLEQPAMAAWLKPNGLRRTRGGSFLVRYGFAGPIVIEVKLTSNKDIQGSKMERSASYTTMKEEYMEGYGASHGVLLVINNTNAQNLPQIKEAFQKIKNVSVASFDCYKSPTAPKRVAAKKRRNPRGQWQNHWSPNCGS
jgi:hypothetical protein